LEESKKKGHFQDLFPFELTGRTKAKRNSKAVHGKSKADQDYLGKCHGMRNKNLLSQAKSSSMVK